MGSSPWLTILIFALIVSTFALAEWRGRRHRHRAEQARQQREEDTHREGEQRLNRRFIRSWTEFSSDRITRDWWAYLRDHPLAEGEMRDSDHLPYPRDLIEGALLTAVVLSHKAPEFQDRIIDTLPPLCRFRDGYGAAMDPLRRLGPIPGNGPEPATAEAASRRTRDDRYRMQAETDTRRLLKKARTCRCGID